MPDLVEYPAVVSGTFADEFLRLPDEVLTTTMIHHQHFFPLVSAQGELMPAFLAVLNMEPEKPELVARNLERVLTARLRDARFFWDADRGQPLEQHRERLATVAFHQGLGSFLDKAERLEPLARWIAADVLGRPEAADAGRPRGAPVQGRPRHQHGARAHRAAGHDWRHLRPRGRRTRSASGRRSTTTTCRPRWRPTRAPTRAELGEAAVAWAAVSLADKLDTVVGMFVAGERPTGSRDPYGIRRAAQGLIRILADLPELTGVDAAVALGPLVERAQAGAAGAGRRRRVRAGALWAFLGDRVRSVFEQRGGDVRNVRAVTHGDARALAPLTVRRKLAVLPELTDSAEFTQLATLFKRVRNIARDLPRRRRSTPPSDAGAADRR